MEILVNCMMSRYSGSHRRAPGYLSGIMYGHVHTGRGTETFAMQEHVLSTHTDLGSLGRARSSVVCAPHNR